MEFNQMFTTIDVHAGGEPLRIITGGLPDLQGTTMMERAASSDQQDRLLRQLMFEPRGHQGMTCCMVTPPVSEDANFGVLFMDQEGWSPMSGHGIIAVATAWIETGRVQLNDGADATIRIDSPAGRITIYPEMEGTEVRAVSFDNVASFVYATDVPISLHGLDFTVDIAFGGAFYAIVNTSVLGGLQLLESELPDIQRWGVDIKAAVEVQLSILHPLEPAIAGLHGVMMVRTQRDPHEDGQTIYRNVTVWGRGQFDRSACGASTSAYVALLIHRKQLKLSETTIHQGIAGTQLTVMAVSEAAVGSYAGILPRLSGNAFITGFHQFVVDPSDPLAEGFLLR